MLLVMVKQLYRPAPGSAPLVLGLATVVAVALHRALPLLWCSGPCFADFASLSAADYPFVHLRYADSCLNSWILAWVGHALATSPASLFDANAFHPATGVLAGSEHMLGVAAIVAPLKLAIDDAARLHQAALLLGYVGTSLATFALTRWLTASVFAATVAGAIAALLPWRYAELEHVQLQSTTWLPLVWLLLTMIVTRGPRIVTVAVLSALSLLQALTSYYLTYLLVVSSAVLLLVLLAVGRSRARSLLVAALALVLPLAIVAVLSLPYLGALDDSLVLRGGLVTSVPLSDAWAQIAPPLALVGDTSLPAPHDYRLPLVVVVLALAGLLTARSPARRSDAHTAGLVAVALWLVIVVSFLLSIGDHVVVAGVRVPLPATLLKLVVPGFDHFRAPLRWGILVCVAMPVLAGLGIHAIEKRFASSRSAVVRVTVRAGLAALLAVALVGPRIVTAPAYQSLGQDLGVYDALGDLEAGPVLEWPWPANAGVDARLSAEYMLASTRHWRPILNGYTGYRPQAYDFLRRVAQQIPAPTAIERVQALTGLRWIVVHTRLLDAPAIAAWDEARFAGKLSLVDVAGGARIYEIIDWRSGGAWLEALLSEEPRATTFAGVAKKPLVLAQGAGRLVANLPAALQPFTDGWLSTRFGVTIHNDSARDWPGLDIQTDGLVVLRQTLTAGDGEIVAEARSPLDGDVPASGSLDTLAAFGARVPAGSYVLRLDLVQQLATGELLLPVPAVEAPVQVLPSEN